MPLCIIPVIHARAWTISKNLYHSLSLHAWILATLMHLKHVKLGGIRTEHRVLSQISYISCIVIVQELRLKTRANDTVYHGLAIIFYSAFYVFYFVFCLSFLGQGPNSRLILLVLKREFHFKSFLSVLLTEFCFASLNFREVSVL